MMAVEFRKAFSIRHDKEFLAEVASVFTSHGLNLINPPESLDIPLHQCIWSLVACLKRKEDIQVATEKAQVEVLS